MCSVLALAWWPKNSRKIFLSCHCIFSYHSSFASMRMRRCLEVSGLKGMKNKPSKCFYSATPQRMRLMKIRLQPLQSRLPKPKSVFPFQQMIVFLSTCVIRKFFLHCSSLWSACVAWRSFVAQLTPKYSVAETLRRHSACVWFNCCFFQAFLFWKISIQVNTAHAQPQEVINFADFRWQQSASGPDNPRDRRFPHQLDAVRCDHVFCGHRNCSGDGLPFDEH